MSSARLNPLPAVEVDGVRILVDKERPVAVLQSDGSNRFVTWPNAPLPPAAANPRVVTAPNAVWVVYEESAEDSVDAASSTAVRIGVDGSASGVIIGGLHVIGADSEGIWATPSPWPSPDPYPRDREDPDDAEAPWNFDGAGLPLESWDDFQKRHQQWSDEDFAKHHEKFLTTRDARGEADGGDEGPFGWFGYPGFRDSEEPAPRLDRPRLPGPSSPVELTRFRGDGRTETLKVDRTVAGLVQEGSSTTLTFFPTTPMETVGHDSGIVHYSNPVSRIVVDFSSGLPSTLAVGEYESSDLPQNDYWEQTWAESLHDPEIAAEDRIDVGSLPGIDWTPADVSRDVIETAVSNLVEQLEALAEPNTVWTRRDDRVHLVESPYRDLSVRVEDGWPATVVVVEFHHREYSDALYRRRYRVFDASGRPIDRRYMTVYLEEDIATGHHPAERDGVIEFLDD